MYSTPPLIIILCGTATSSSHDRGDDGEEDLWTIWGRIVNDWDNYIKKKNSFVRVGIPCNFFINFLK